ncbi:unnamed protein product [Coffea canephora]|uniref:Uncharacterized protein n=1 Tax=Coffea canephora TaxID=49390 RepID=A0A068UJV9_COFCA|nr:unnamed protein product [Coffea canephora]
MHVLLTFAEYLSPILICPLKVSSSRTTLYGAGFTSMIPLSFPSTIIPLRKILKEQQISTYN